MLTFSRTKFSEAQAAALNAAVVDGPVTPAMASAATQLLQQKMREVKLAEPHADGHSVFMRVMAAFPESTALVHKATFHGLTASVDGITEEA